jgi:hypothetical protein
MERYRQWFGVRFEFLLFDVTSTYFEGQAQRNAKAIWIRSDDASGVGRVNIPPPHACWISK